MTEFHTCALLIFELEIPKALFIGQEHIIQLYTQISPHYDPTWFTTIKRLEYDQNQVPIGGHFMIEKDNSNTYVIKDFNLPPMTYVNNQPATPSGLSLKSTDAIMLPLMVNGNTVAFNVVFLIQWIHAQPQCKKPYKPAIREIIIDIWRLRQIGRASCRERV